MHLHPKLCKWVNSCIPLKFSIKRIRFQLHSLLIFCFMAPNLWFKTPLNAIQGLTTCPVRNGLHIGRADFLPKKLLQKRFFTILVTIYVTPLTLFGESMMILNNKRSKFIGSNNFFGSSQTK